MQRSSPTWCRVFAESRRRLLDWSGSRRLGGNDENQRTSDLCGHQHWPLRAFSVALFCSKEAAG